MVSKVVFFVVFVIFRKGLYGFPDRSSLDNDSLFGNLFDENEQEPLTGLAESMDHMFPWQQAKNGNEDRKSLLDTLGDWRNKFAPSSTSTDKRQEKDEGKSVDETPSSVPFRLYPWGSQAKEENPPEEPKKNNPVPGKNDWHLLPNTEFWNPYSSKTDDPKEIKTVEPEKPKDHEINRWEEMRKGLEGKLPEARWPVFPWNRKKEDSENGKKPEEDNAKEKNDDDGHSGNGDQDRNEEGEENHDEDDDENEDNHDEDEDNQDDEDDHDHDGDGEDEEPSTEFQDEGDLKKEQEDVSDKIDEAIENLEQEDDLNESGEDEDEDDEEDSQHDEEEEEDEDNHEPQHSKESSPQQPDLPTTLNPSSKADLDGKGEDDEDEENENSVEGTGDDGDNDDHDVEGGKSDEEEEDDEDDEEDEDDEDEASRKFREGMEKFSKDKPENKQPGKESKRPPSDLADSDEAEDEDEESDEESEEDETERRNAALLEYADKNLSTMSLLFSLGREYLADFPIGVFNPLNFMKRVTVSFASINDLQRDPQYLRKQLIQKTNAKYGWNNKDKLPGYTFQLFPPAFYVE